MATRVKELYQNLLKLWKLESKDLKKIAATVADLKVEFMSLPFLPTTDKDKKEHADIMQVQRDVLEISVLLSVLEKDIPAFERGVSQLKHYYGEVEPSLDVNLSESPQKYQMLGLDLLCLLAQNKLPEFHMELERIPPQTGRKNPFIDAPVRLEQFLMEGAYNKIFLERKNMPTPYYDFFVDILLDTVRDEIASCMEKAYDNLGIQESASMLFLDGKDGDRKAAAYGKKRGWLIGKDGKSFVFSESSSKTCAEENQSVDAKKLAEQNIFYAKQLEMIV